MAKATLWLCSSSSQFSWLPFERIKLLQGDSDELITGSGTGGSKSIMHLVELL